MAANANMCVAVGCASGQRQAHSIQHEPNLFSFWRGGRPCFQKVNVRYHEKEFLFFVGVGVAGLGTSQRAAASTDPRPARSPDISTGRRRVTRHTVTQP